MCKLLPVATSLHWQTWYVAMKHLRELFMWLCNQCALALGSNVLKPWGRNKNSCFRTHPSLFFSIFMKEMVSQVCTSVWFHSKNSCYNGLLVVWQVNQNLGCMWWVLNCICHVCFRFLLRFIGSSCISSLVYTLYIFYCRANNHSVALVDSRDNLQVF